MNKRGLLIGASDFNSYWVKLASRAGLTTLGLHPMPGVKEDDPRSLEFFLEIMRTDSFKKEACMLKDQNIDLEIEAHAMHWLMPRKNFESHPEWFRMNEEGERCGDLNFCPSNENALQYVEDQTERLVQRLAPCCTTHRYYLWIDDNSKFCHCDECEGSTASDQALIIYNRMLKGVRKADPSGTLSYLAYQNTIAVPSKVRPDPGIFLEYAPVDRDSRFSMGDASVQKNVSESAPITALLKFFGKEGSQVLEYWMDNSYFYRWTLPYGELPFYRGVLHNDVRFYTAKGFQHITSFACGLNQEYESNYGEPPVVEYARILRGENI
jgi:hypothetical protein